MKILQREIEKRIEEKVNEFVLWTKSKLGRDIFYLNN